MMNKYGFAFVGIVALVARQLFVMGEPLIAVFMLALSSLGLASGVVSGIFTDV